MDQLQAMSRSIFACDARMVLRPQNEIRMGQAFFKFYFFHVFACDARMVLCLQNEMRMGPGFMLLVGQGFMLLAIVVVFHSIRSMMNTNDSRVVLHMCVCVRVCVCVCVCV